MIVPILLSAAFAYAVFRIVYLIGDVLVTGIETREASEDAAG